MSDPTIVPASQTGDEGKDPSQRIERTPEEIASYNLKKKADEAKALGLNPEEIIGGKSNDDSEVPAWYKAEKAKEVKKTSLELAEAISDEDTKNKVKDYLQNRLVPSGNPEEDFRLALGAASAGKNKQILEEMNRYTPPRVVVSGSSQPAKIEEEFIPTEEEARMMQPPYKLSKEKVLAARAAHEAKQK